MNALSLLLSSIGTVNPGQKKTTSSMSNLLNKVERILYRALKQNHQISGAGITTAKNILNVIHGEESAAGVISSLTGVDEFSLDLKSLLNTVVDTGDITNTLSQIATAFDKEEPNETLPLISGVP